MIDALDGAVGRTISAISGVGAGIALVVMTVVETVSRSVLNISLPLTIEYAEYLIPVVGLVGAAHALRHRDHVRADLALHRLPPTPRRWLIIAGDLIVLIAVTFETAREAQQLDERRPVRAHGQPPVVSDDDQSLLGPAPRPGR